jgi:hypothetical protein
LEKRIRPKDIMNLRIDFLFPGHGFRLKIALLKNMRNVTLHGLPLELQILLGSRRMR